MPASYTTATASPKQMNGASPSTTHAMADSIANLTPLSIRPSTRRLTSKATILLEVQWRGMAQTFGRSKCRR